jgi:DNA (cytosine-5)-methyltransferase 1
MARRRNLSTQADQPLTAVDLFCGAGGLSKGLTDAGFEILAAADHDPDACATYRSNNPGAVIVEGDLSDRENQEAILGISPGGQLDLLAGGPPCQSFSQIHNHDRLLGDPRNRLYREFVEILGKLRPRALLLENVPGMNQLAGGAVRRQIEEDLSLDGHYTVISGVLDAGDFGTPQRRPRLVFIGLEKGAGEPALPGGTGVTQILPEAGARQRAKGRIEETERLREILQDPSDLRAVTVEQALGDLRDSGPSYTRDPRSAFQVRARRGSVEPQDHVPSRIRLDTVRRLEAIPPGGNVHDLPEELLQRYLSAERWGPAGNGKRLARRHFYAYRRLHPEWLAWTVNTKADFAYHYELPRGLSVREAARLQGFPDSYHFTTAPPGTPGQYKNGARHSRYRQVGNAVPPTLSKAVGNKLTELLTSSSKKLAPVELAAA